MADQWVWLLGRRYLKFRRLMLLLAGWSVLSPALALESITLQLKWHHAFQFAGYYAAKEKGYYQEAGLDVTLREAKPGVNVLAALQEGRAQYGVGTSSLLLERAAGQPVVVLSVVFQHSPLVLLARQRQAQQVPGSQGVHDLDGSRIMIEPHSDELLAYLKHEGLALDRMVQVPHSFDSKDLMTGKVDAMSAYLTNEPYYLDGEGFSYQTYTPRSAGIDFYGDNLFTTEAELQAHPERVRAFRDASMRGWRYAMAHQDEIAELIYANYSQANSKDFYLYEARRMVPLLRTDLVDVGYMTQGRWEHIANTYADLGLLPRKYRLDGFLYQPDARPDRRPLYLALAGLVVVSGVAAYILFINRRLARALAEKTRAEEQVRQLAFFDPLTALPNRRLLQDRLSRLMAELKRNGGHGALLFLDLDNFKVLNDTQGHEFGDLLLMAAAGRLQEGLRDSDTVARFGGDEFVVLLGALDADQALAVSQARGVADKILIRLAQPYGLTSPRGGPVVQHVCSASIGIALLNGATTADDAQRRADAAMYQAKDQGRNQVVMGGVDVTPMPLESSDD